MTLLLSLLFATPALAQDAEAPDQRPIQYEQRQVVDFEKGLELNGELVKPAIQPIIERVRASFNPFIVLRDSFAPEMKRSVDEIQ